MQQKMYVTSRITKKKLIMAYLQRVTKIEQHIFHYRTFITKLSIIFIKQLTCILHPNLNPAPSKQQLNHILAQWQAPKKQVVSIKHQKQPNQ